MTVNRMGWLWLCIVSIVVLMMALGVHFAKAQHTHEGVTGKFYKSWMQPDNRSISCCHDQDCAPAQSRRVNGSWQARNSDDEEWVNIPPRKVETERDSPDGQSHLCKMKTFNGTYVYCFLPAAGG